MTARPARWPGLVAALLLLIGYGLTAAHDLMWYDTGELALVAHDFGLGHPPGQPLYTLLAGLFGRLPGLAPLWGMNLLSVLCGAACALPADALARRAAPAAPPWLRCLAVLAVGALVPLWDQSTRIEVYAPGTLGALTLLAAAGAAIDAGRADVRVWLGLGALAGLTSCVNVIFGVSAALGAGLAAVPMLAGSGRFALPRATLSAAFGAALGFLPYGYLFAVRRATDRLVWGEWQSDDGLWSYLAGRDYAHTDHSAWDAVPGHLLDQVGWLAAHGALPVIACGLLGALATPWLRRRAPLWLLPAVAGVAFSLTYRTFYPDIPDFQSYFAPALWLGAAGLTGLLGRLRPTLAAPAALALLGATLFAGERPLPDRDRSDLRLARTVAETWLDAMPRDAVLIVSSDHLVFPLMYLQEAESRRLDVVLINEGFAASGWYWRHLYRRHPDLPAIDLAAADNGTRLRRLLTATQRPARVESVRIAAALRLRPCPATWGFAVGPACLDAVDDPAGFQTGLAGWWRGPAGHDPTSVRVLAALAQSRAEGQWVLGDAAAALRTLRAGVPPEIADTLPVPDVLATPPGAPPLALAGGLIGHPTLNLLLGAEALRALGRPEAEAWRAAAP